MKIGVIGAAMAGAMLIHGPALAQAQQRPAAQPAARPAQPAARPAQPAARPAAAAQQRGPQVPQAQGLLLLIRSTMIAFDQANKTNVYHVLYGLGSDRFRASNTPDRLSQSFAAFRTNNVDLSPVAILSPQLARQPAIEQGRLHLVGFYPTNPNRITFDMWFEPSQNRWKLTQLNVGLAQAVQQGQQAQQPPQGRRQPAQPAQRPRQPAQR